MRSLPPVDIWDSTYTRHRLLCKQTGWAPLETEWFLRLFWHLFSLWRMAGLFVNISPFHFMVHKYFYYCHSSGRQILWIYKPNSEPSSLLAICHYQIIRFASVNPIRSEGTNCFRALRGQLVFFKVFNQLCCHFTSVDSKWLDIKAKKADSIQWSHCIYTLCTSQDRRSISCALCIHLFPHLLSHSSINDLLALHGLREWLFFVALGLLYFTDIYTTLNCQFTAEREEKRHAESLFCIISPFDKAQ